ncbi:MAG: fasciclin domain-containing protein [Flavobacteriales bacterium]|nr:fasciclin domain-containing protein [Flavobacteriales bacterium]MCX7651212.1 fasciclin domain-containing protein [Flavobacteriales bacterium]MDW8432461.1 fasciclin domain-containing protein [Flavobacteriales bacterium]
MKKIALSLLAVSAVLYSCGGNADKEAERKKREADSLARLEQARKDSMEKAMAAARKNVVETALADPNFSTLTALLEQAGLTATLKDSTKNFTVFAPTNLAFEALGQAELDKLKKDTKRLRDVLLYHVVEGKRMAADVNSTPEFMAMNGKKIVVAKGEAGTMVANALITTADLDCSNGVIHVVNAVMSDKPAPAPRSGKGGPSAGKQPAPAPTPTPAPPTKPQTTEDKIKDKMSGKREDQVEQKIQDKMSGKREGGVEQNVSDKMKRNNP